MCVINPITTPKNLFRQRNNFLQLEKYFTV